MDVETLVPVVGANVVSKVQTAQTDSLGCVFVSDSCQTLVFSHVNYESRMVNVTELRDTVFLISKLLNLKEVVVFGKGKGNDELTERLRKQMRIDKTEKELAAADPSAGFNVLGLVSKLFSRRKESKKEKLRRILEDY